MQEVIRTASHLAGASAERHDNKIVSVFRHRDDPAPGACSAGNGLCVRLEPAPQQADPDRGR
nr:hypothetical protein OG781_12650 [Streptomyces sp. NBC_00830]